jgi:predicted NACHT family NTPase
MELRGGYQYSYLKLLFLKHKFLYKFILIKFVQSQQFLTAKSLLKFVDVNSSQTKSFGPLKTTCKEILSENKEDFYF